MKKYLLFLFAMLSGSIGAWAEDATISGGNGSRVIIKTNGDADLSALASSIALSGNWGSNTASDNAVQVNGAISQTGLNVIGTMMSKNSEMFYLADKILYLDGVTFSGTITSLPAGTSTSSSIKFASCILPWNSELPAIPSGYNYVYSGCTNGGTIRIYVKEGTTSVPQLTSEQIEAASQIEISGSGKDAFIATLSETAREKLPFDGSLAITTTASNNVQSQIEAYLISKGIITSEATSEAKATALGQITSLSISGPLTATDLTYLSTLTNLKTLNLTGLSSFGSGVSTATIADALGSDVVVTYPPLLYDYNCTTGTTTITVLNTGNATVKNLEAAGVPQYVNKANNISTIKICGNVNGTDIGNIVAKSIWCTVRIDLSEATITGSIPNLSSINNSNTYYIILPSGSSYPTDAEVAYTVSGSESSIYNKGGILKYIIIPAPEANGRAKMFVNNAKDNGMASAIDAYDIALINANNPSVIDVYNLNGAFDATSFSTLKENINSTWSSKNVIYHKTMNPTVIDGCNVTIDMNEAGSKTLDTLIAEAHTAVTKAGQSGICTLTVNGPLSAGDVTALNTAMGSGGNLASITGLYLGGATGVSQEQVNGLNIPTTLTRLTIPSDRIVAGGLVTKAKAATSLNYVYSPTSSSSRTVAEQFSPDYVYVLNPGSLSTAVRNEEGLQKGVYIKIGTPSGVNLSVDDAKFGSMSIDFTDATNYGWQYIDMSGAGVTAVATLAETAPNKDYGYRIVLPDGLTGDNMAIFASNPDHGKVAAVYSYTDTKLNLMEITDDKYVHSALADSRIMRSTTTEVEVVSGTYNGDTYSAFGNNLLTAINNMGNSTSYPSSTGLNVKKVSISTGANVTSPMNFNNPTIETLELKNVSLAWAVLNVDACSSLKTLNLNYANLGNVSAKTSTLTKVDLSGTTLNNSNIGDADFSGASLTNGFVTDDDTKIWGNLVLKNTSLTSYIPYGTVGGDIYLNASNSLASIDVRHVNMASGKKIHIDADATESEANTTSIATLHVANAITVPTGYVVADHFHPVDDIQESYIKEEAYIPPMFTTTPTDMMLHEKNANSDGDNFIYWYQDTEHMGSNVTIGTSSESGHSLAEIITAKKTDPNFSTTTYRRARITGPVTSTDIDDLANINCQVLDLSKATFDAEAWAELKKAFASTTSNVHSNVRFVILPDGSTRDDILNDKALAGLTNVLSVISTEKITGAADASDNGTNLTTWSRVSGAVQAAVVAAGNHSCESWKKTPDGETARNIYTSDVSDFRVCQISGLINSHDLSKANQQLDAYGHLSWTSDPVEISSGTDPRTINGKHTAYGPFSASFQLTEIDLRDAYFEPVDNSSESEYKRYYCSDMTLSALGIISTDTYKVVIPQTSTVREIPADFMNCSTNIRAICIPSNIRAIRTRAFYTIDYVWTTGDVDKDPEGENTKLDNGAKLSTDMSINENKTFIEISALKLIVDPVTKKYKYIENPEFTKACYTADYSTINGGGTYTIGSNIKLIETGAFANTQPNVKDVYVLNTIAPECHVDAFNTMMYTGNGGYEPTLTEGIITRNNYFNSRWITMLHYPRQTTTPDLQRYTDPTRQYSIATGERDGKGATLYFPSQSEFIRAYTQGTFGYIWNAWDPTRQFGAVNNGDLTGHTTTGWTTEGQATANGLYSSNKVTSADIHKYTSFYDVTLGSNTKPSDLVDYYKIYWNETSYSEAASQGKLLYLRSEVEANSDADNSGEKTTKDYRGWHQFVLNAYAANTILDEEPYRSYVADNDWWTICSPFDITRKEAILLFGTEGDTHNLPYVSKLQYVRRTYAEPKIHLNFSPNLMLYKEDRADASDPHGQNDDKGVVKLLNTPPGDNDVVIAAGVPYMIKPYMTSGGLQGGFNRQFHVYTDADYEKLTDEQKAVTSPKPVKSTSLHDKIKASQELSGTQQMELIHRGKYSVPVFVYGTNDGYTTEEKTTVTYPIGETEYSKSLAFYYTFVGTFYNSFMPQYAYFLGWNGSKAQFFYNDGAYDGNNMHWANETGIICPTTSAFTAKVTPAKVNTNVGLVPAQWELNGIVNDDSFTAVSGSRGARSFDMTFDSPEVIAVGSDVTGISELPATDASQHQSGGLKVYSVDGQLKGHSLDGLRKGIYVVNGMKYVVK